MQPTPEDARYLSDFHRAYFGTRDKGLQKDRLALYVDYSTCIATGQNSQFFQAMSAPLIDRASDYFAIKGSDIQGIDITAAGGTYSLLRNIVEVDYAQLDKAVRMAADGQMEAVVLTDGEFYTPSIAKGHDNDPYMAAALRTWLLKGHDVHIFSEPYTEMRGGQAFQKKRFYIVFTDDRLEGNIYERIIRTVDLESYPDVDEFHLSAGHPRLAGTEDGCTWQSEVLDSHIQGYGDYEVADWSGCDWGTIEEELVGGTDEETGEPLAAGKPVVSLTVDKNSFGCYRIKSVGVKVWNINSEYNDFYTAKAEGAAVPKLDAPQAEIDHFMAIDDKEFDRHGKANISFDSEWFDPSALNGSPYNYLMIRLYVKELSDLFARHEDKFAFESISQPGTKNVSVASSIRQCISDPEVLDRLRGQTIYTIYVKSEQK